MANRIIDYKRELEQAAKSMILIHDPNLLIKMIVRMIVQKVGVRHAGILLYNKDNDNYVLTISGGEKGYKIPSGFARMDSDNPLICFFKKSYDERLFGERILEAQKLNKLIRNKKQPREKKSFFEKVYYQMKIFETVACIPSFFRDSLLGILLLGERRNDSRFKQDELDFFGALASDTAMAIRNAQLFEELEAELAKRHNLFIHTTIALAAAIDAKDHYTHGHTARVTAYSLAIAQELKKQKRLNDDFIEKLHIASLLHDIGKIGMPERLLNKNCELTVGERKIIQQHPLVGVNILQPIKELSECLPGVKYHHERYDGKGYPEGLKGKQIPLMASIIAIADAFDAMTTDRSYRKARTKEEAIAELKRHSGRQFDPQVVRIAESVLLEFIP